MKALKGIINKQKSNFPLDQVFFKDQKIFDLDLKTFFFNQWIIVGHESRIIKRGEYFLSNMKHGTPVIPLAYAYLVSLET